VQRIDEEKRKRIIAVAGKLFSERPFHEVRLEDVAAEAHIGKGTIYVYFRSKANLCQSLMLDGMGEAIAEARKQVQMEGLTSLQKIDRVLRSLTSIAGRYVYARSLELEVGRTAEYAQSFNEKRLEMFGIVEGVLREGIASGEIDDPHPEITARCLLASLREFLFYPPVDVPADVLTDHMMAVLRQGILKHA